MHATKRDMIQENENGLHFSKEEILEDYRLAYKSRQVSLIGRKEVLTGKAKFGIFGDGKELPQLAMARAFRKGDFRSGYYRDQTFTMATGIQSIPEFFAQLYADTDMDREPNSGGRQMNAHFASRSLHPDGSWKDLTDQYNSYADVSPTASQMQRMVGLVHASKIYREVEALKSQTGFSKNGEEVVFGTIGNASCAEGHFWETINAIGIIGGPLVMSVWDDGYGISVPNEFQVTKSSISEVLKGFQRDGDSAGYEIFVVKGWDYLKLREVYHKAADLARYDHVPCLIHVIEVTQPQGHSTSGSHERYKSQERLDWEKEYDCMEVMRDWILESGIAAESDLAAWEKEARKEIRNIKNESFATYLSPIKEEVATAASLIRDVAGQVPELEAIAASLEKITEPFRANIMEAIFQTRVTLHKHGIETPEKLRFWKQEQDAINQGRFNTTLYSEQADSALRVAEVKPAYSDDSPEIPGFEVLNRFFDGLFSRDVRVVGFGEDVGHLGDVNQGFAGLQAKHGQTRIFDTGIREATIMGQAIGMASRGLRPIAEIQYLDYFIYGLQTLSDDLATLRYRTRGGQKAPAIIRTRGHRLEGIWHAGSPMGMIIHALRGMYVCVPRNMTQAAGFYNTLMKGEEPGVIVEVLNGYRLKEKCPDNLDEFTVPLGVPEVLREGTDVTVVTYGACCRIVMEAASKLAELGVEIEVIDVQTLLPFDRNHHIVDSIKKTNRILFVDEDVPGGASAYMMKEVLETQGGYYHLDAKPGTLTSKPHRPAYGTDGDYFSKPQVEHVFEAVWEMVSE